MRSIPWLLGCLSCWACASEVPGTPDAGAGRPDAVIFDAAVGPADTGVESSDAGAILSDAGAVLTDAGVALSDAGVELTDAGLDPSDTGVEPSDAGLGLTDAGLEPTDAGVSLSDAGGDLMDAGLAGNPPIFVFLSGRPISPGFPGDLSVAIQDADGPADVVGGEVRDVAGRLIGALSVGPPHDAWRASLSIPLSWEAIAALAPINFAPPRGSYGVIATVWDRAGARATMPFSLSLRCLPPSLGACDSVCVALDTDQNCGACGHRCSGSSRCVSGACSP